MLKPGPDIDSIQGCLIGGAIGDAIGLPFEGISPRRQRRLAPDGPLRHRFILGRGMCSDDTEHACMTAQALLVSGGNPERFTSSLAWRLRFWLLGLPAGIGSATLRSILKLWIGFPPHRSGIHSAGNGPAMRAPILGTCCEGDLKRLKEWVAASTRLTHSDPKAEVGALAVALAAWVSSDARGKADAWSDFPDRLNELLGERRPEELLALIKRAHESARRGGTTAEFAGELGLANGVTGYINHTVPVALHACFRHGSDFRAAITNVIACGGDTDTTAAIVGGIVGAAVGVEGLPQDWLNGLWEWPRTEGWMKALGAHLAKARAEDEPSRAQPLAVPLILARNLLFLSAVLAHGFRRLLPPY